MSTEDAGDTPRMTVRFWGVRGSCPAAYPSHMRVGGNTPCVELRVSAADGHPEELVVLDAGSGIIALGRELALSGEPRHIHVLLTHYHWDHISGLPFFAPAFIPGWKVTIHGPGDSAAQVEGHMAAQMRSPYFPVEIETWLADMQYRPVRDPMTIGAAGVSCFPVQHPGSTVGYRLDCGGRSIVYAPDSELALPDAAFAARRAEFDDDERTLLDEMKAEEADLDLNHMRDVDLLIHDAQYTETEYATKRGWGHSCYEDVVRAAIQANTRELCLFSHDPSHDDEHMLRIEAHAQLMTREHGSNMGCTIAREGSRTDLL